MKNIMSLSYITLSPSYSISVIIILYFLREGIYEAEVHEDEDSCWQDIS